MKVDFKTFLFTDESRASFNDSDNWNEGCVINGPDLPQRLKHQRGLVWFYGISIIVVYLMLNPLYTLNI